jgi:rhamnulokinase
MPDRHFLAFDLGAESGRALIGSYSKGVLALQEAHRFLNEPVRTHAGLQWDILRLWHEMQHALKEVSAVGLESMAVDAWGVDYALLGPGGTLLENPYHYRDSRTDGILEQILAIVPAADIYAQTGIQFMQINTLCQLYAARLANPGLLELAKCFLTIPDLLNYWLTGVMASEFTNATTTQFLNPTLHDWARPLLEHLEIPTHLLPAIIEPGTFLGSTKTGIRVVAPACHDTGSAVAAIPLRPDTAYISSGTWSLMGVEILAPILTEQARLLNFTNEGGVCGTIRVLRNIMGMWLLQCCRRVWGAADYGELISLAESEPRLSSLIDPDDSEFLHPKNMPEAISAFCSRTDQAAPADHAAFIHTILESLALRYRHVLECLERLTGTRYNEIRVVGGGARNRALNQFTADATGRRVIAGPVEATALGNIGMQLLATGAVSSLAEVRGVIERSFPTELFEPRDSSAWDSAYRRFRQFERRTPMTA